MGSIQIDRTDGLASSVAIKGPVKTATTANISLAGLQVVGGVSLAVDDRVLVKDQASAPENGIYVVDTGPWRRSRDFNKTRDVMKGTLIFVTSGTSIRRWYSLVSDDPVNIGTSDVNFALADDVAAAAASAAAAAASAAEAVAAASSVQAELDSRAYAIASYHPIAPPSKIRVSFYDFTQVEGSGGVYKQVVTEPTHAGKFSITLADGVTVVWYEIAEGVLTPPMFGAKGDGTNDRVALTNMFGVTAVSEFDGLGRTYTIDQTILVQRSNVYLRNLTTTGVIANTTPSIKFLGAEGTPVSLTVATGAGTNTFTVADTTSFSEDQWVWLRSETTLWSAIKFGEIAKIRSIDAGTGVVTLYDRVFLYYNTSDTARAIPLTMRDDIVVENCGVRGDVSVTNQIGMEFEFCSNVEVRNPRTSDCEYVHIWFKTVAQGKVLTGLGERTGTLQGLNYAIVAGNSCNDILVQGYTSRSARHCVATGGSFGVNRNVKAYKNTALDSLDAGFDAHPQTAECDYSYNTVHMRQGVAAGADGIICQGAVFIAKGNQIYGPTRHGAFYQPNLALAGIKNSSIIEGNKCVNIQGAGTTSGVNIVAGVAGSDISSVNVSNNMVDGFVNGLFALASVADILDINVAVHSAQNNTGRGVMFQASSGRVIGGGTISGSSIKQAVGAFEAIYLNAAAASGIVNVAVSGNKTDGGTYGVRGANTNWINTSGNVVRNASTTAISVAGANSVLGTNAT